MIRYCVRLILGGLTKLLLSALMLYSLLVYAPGGVREMFQRLSSELGYPVYRDYKEWPFSWEFDKPWPVSYFAWLFDPEDTLAPPIYDLQGYPQQRPTGINIEIGSLQIKGSGILTGDLGQSWNIDLEKSVAAMLGPGIGKMFAFLITLIAALMALVAAQRWRRPQPYRASTLPTASALVDWWHLHSRSLDVAIMDRQWA